MEEITRVQSLAPAVPIAAEAALAVDPVTEVSTPAPGLRSPLSESASIVVVGLQNAGKSSLINTLFERDVSIVSSVPGTTTDPVSRKMLHRRFLVSVGRCC